jgi:hypothetical protein
MSYWRDLIKAGKFDEALPLMLAETEKPDGYGGETVTRAEFYEAWGDSLRPAAEAEWKYWDSHRYWAIFASWATSGGEGTARMLDVDRVVKKIEALQNRLEDQTGSGAGA